jgi:hypothetical protein
LQKFLLNVVTITIGAEYDKFLESIAIDIKESALGRIVNSSTFISSRPGKNELLNPLADTINQVFEVARTKQAFGGRKVRCLHAC